MKLKKLKAPFNLSRIIWSISVTMSLVLVLAWLSTGRVGFWGWSSFLTVFILVWVILLVAWRLAQQDRPPIKILNLVLFAAVLRLALGVFWFAGLPVWGYENQVNQAGYVMLDAYERDGAAWALAQSDDGLLESFFDYSGTDQYGGLLAFSGFIYRYFGTDSHQSMLITVVTAAFSALTVLFTWLVANRLVGVKVANLSAWLIVFYPEAILQGSAQVREAFLMTLTMLFVWQVILIVDNRRVAGLIWIGLTLGVSFLLSYPFAGMLLTLGVLFPYYLLETDDDKKKYLKFIWIASGVFLVGLVLLSGDLYSWIDHTLWQQKFTAQRESGLIQYIFENTPTWFDLPFITAYGVVRPLLPPAIFDTSILVWRTIAIFRSAGWTVVLALLIYATYLSFSKDVKLAKIRFLVWFNWFIVLFSAVRGYGDLWDNPRYRVTFVGVQVFLVVWGLARQRETGDPWLLRFMMSTGLLVLWFFPFYYERKVGEIGWPVDTLLGAVIWGLVLVFGYVWWDIGRKRRMMY